MKKQCEQEVIDLHQFFEGWFTGKLSGDEDFARLETAVADNFLIISPNARQTECKMLLQSIKNTQGAFKKPDHNFRIWIENFQFRYQKDNLCLVTYEEWQEHDGQTNGRLSSALFQKDKDAPNGVVWIHVHEVAFPTD